MRNFNLQIFSFVTMLVRNLNHWCRKTLYNAYWSFILILWIKQWHLFLTSKDNGYYFNSVFFTLGTVISSIDKPMSKFNEWMILFISKHRNCIKAKILHKTKYIVYVYSGTVIHEHCYRLNCITRHHITHGKSLMSLNINKCENGVFKSTMWSDFWWNFSIFGTRYHTIFCAHLDHAM